MRKITLLAVLALVAWAPTAGQNPQLTDLSCCDPEDQPGISGQFCAEGVTCCASGHWQCNDAAGDSTCALDGELCRSCCDPLAEPVNRNGIVETCLKALDAAKAYGLNSIVDATPSDLSRDVDIMKEVSEKAQVNVICSTGRYGEEGGKWTYLKFRNQTAAGDLKKELYDGFMCEITQGIGQSGIKPGVIKVATGHGRISPCEEALLRAAAQASNETGLPIITHTEEGTMGPEQAELLTGEGVAPEKIMIGHMCGNASLQYQKAVLKTGVNISFDRFGVDISMTDHSRLATLTSLLREGYSDRVMLSHDHVSSSFGRSAGRHNIWPEDLYPEAVNWSFFHIFRTIIPRLKQTGVTDEQIRIMMADNPRRLLSGA